MLKCFPIPKPLLLFLSFCSIWNTSLRNFFWPTRKVKHFETCCFAQVCPQIYRRQRNLCLFYHRKKLFSCLDSFAKCLASEQKHNTICFRSVAVITCASHAQGPRFDPGRKQIGVSFFNFSCLLPLHWSEMHLNTAKRLFSIPRFFSFTTLESFCCCFTEAPHCQFSSEIG